MKILSIQSEPVVEIPFLNAGRRPGGYYVDSLPIYVATVDRLPVGCDAIVATAGLQGRETFPGNKHRRLQNGLRLLGEVLPEYLTDGVLRDLDVTPERAGVFLAGDFYTVPALDKRGGSGDVTSVWQAFGDRFSRVVGVAGNHDTFGDARVSNPRFSGNLHFLGGSRTETGGLQSSSPAIDKGSTTYNVQHEFGTLLDIDWNFRMINGRIDMGACEKQ